MRGCLNADEILDLLGKRLSGARQNEIHAHLADCADCSALLAASSRTSTPRAASWASGQAEAGVRIGRYQVEELIGCGGHGAVYRCLDPSLGRVVALKVPRLDRLIPTEGDGERVERLRAALLEEARLMAQLAHPHVVSVFDVDVFEDQIYIVMEFVEGQTLRHRLQAGTLGWRETVALFLAAGRGLAAAHAAGLIHRDFKPENVLLGKDGAVKVADFGLARAAGETARLGRAVGTPSYRSPEQLRGQASGALGDQFSFCVALHEALYGVPPYLGRIDLAQHPAVVPSRSGTSVPAWVRMALLRGLSISPEARYPTLTELLEALSDDPSVGRRRTLAFVGSLALLIATAAASAFVVFHRQAVADPCHAPEDRLVGVWDTAVRERMQAAYLATGVADASAAAAYAVKAMDRASDAWLGAYRDACEATRVRQVQPEVALNLRLDCLEDERLDLLAASDLIAHPDLKRLSTAIGAAVSLPLPSECGDPHALAVIEQPSPARRPQAAALRLRLAKGAALNGAGRYEEALEVLKPLPQEAGAFEDHRLEARALDTLAYAYGNEALDYQAAIQLDGQAESLAEAAHDDRLAVVAGARKVRYQVFFGSPRSEIDATLARTQDNLRRAGGSGVAEHDFEVSFADVENARGHEAEGIRHARRALTLAETLYGSDHAETLSDVTNLACLLEPVGGYDEMILLLRRAIAGSDSVLGPNNPRAILPELNLLEGLFDLGRWSEAEQILKRLLARPASEGRGDAMIGLAIEAAMLPPGAQREASLQDFRRELAKRATPAMLASPNWTDVHRYGMEAYLRTGNPQLAVLTYEKYLASQDLAADSSAWVAYLRLGGWAYLDAGQPQKALPILERALKLCAAHPTYPSWVPRLRYQIAKALVLTHSDRQRARDFARQAHDELVSVDVDKDLLAEIDAWTDHTLSLRAPLRPDRP